MMQVVSVHVHAPLLGHSGHVLSNRNLGHQYFQGRFLGNWNCGYIHYITCQNCRRPVNATGPIEARRPHKVNRPRPARWISLASEGSVRPIMFESHYFRVAGRQTTGLRLLHCSAEYRARVSGGAESAGVLSTLASEFRVAWLPFDECLPTVVV